MGEQTATSTFWFREITVYHLHLPLRRPWVTSYGVQSSQETLLGSVVEGNSGRVGWIEVSSLPMPFYLPEFTEGVFLLLRKLLPELLHHSYQHPSKVVQKWSSIRGNYFTKAFIDLLGWCGWCLVNNFPLYKGIGGERTFVHVATTLSSEISFSKLSKLISTIEEKVEMGLSKLRFKISPATSFPIFQEIRKRFPKLLIWVDANGSFSRKDLDQLVSLADMGIDGIEQPFPFRDMLSHRELQSRLKIPVILDEGISSEEDLETALALEACRGVVIKIAKMGGITSVLKIIEKCRENRLLFWIGSMLETEVGTSLNLSLASALAPEGIHDLNPSFHHFDRVIGEPILQYQKDDQGCLGFFPLERPWVGMQLNINELVPYIRGEYSIGSSP